MNSDKGPGPGTNPGKRLKIGLFLSLVFATVMGTGPGLLLINDGRQILGVPAIYAWAVFWFLVQVVVVATAFCTIWKKK